MNTQAILVNDILKAGFGAVEVGEPGEQEVLARAEVSLVSTGTEIRIFRLGHPNTEFPIVPGYSAVGTVQETGSGVTGIKNGDSVFLPGGNRITDGAGALWGAHCLHHTVAADSLIKLPEGCSPDQAGFINVAGIALHGVGFADMRAGERAVVIGLGLIGQCSVRCLLARGAEVIACDIDPDRRALAEGIGVPCIDPAAGELSEQVYARWEEGPDAVFEVTARADMVNVAANLLGARPWDGSGRAPRLVLQAHYTESFSFGARDLFQREAMVLSPRANLPADRELAAELIADGALNLDNLVPARSRPQDAADVYGSLLENPGNQVTAIFDWNEV
jgi:2-desacetyl-2-hydroxyethyl bacteriochlorophyllide A dehydrogenase